jgi:hypothetical protein
MTGRRSTMTREQRGTPPRSKRPQRPPSYAEEVNEAPTVLDEEPVDVEENHPADKRSSVQGEPDDAERAPPVFED